MKHLPVCAKTTPRVHGHQASPWLTAAGLGFTSPKVEDKGGVDSGFKQPLHPPRIDCYIQSDQRAVVETTLVAFSVTFAATSLFMASSAALICAISAACCFFRLAISAAWVFTA